MDFLFTLAYEIPRKILIISQIRKLQHFDKESIVLEGIKVTLRLPAVNRNDFLFFTVLYSFREFHFEFEFSLKYFQAKI